MTLLKGSFSLSLCAILFTASAARADLILEFGDQAGAANFTTEVGQAVVVPIFVAQTTPTTVLADSGLASYRVRGTFSGELGDITQLTDSTGFDFPLSSVNVVDNTAGTFEIGAGRFLAPALTGERVQIAEVVIEPTRVGVNQFVLGDPRPQSDDFGLNGNASFAFDSELFGPSFDQTFSFTVTAVPEPSGLLAIGVATGCVGLRSRRRRV